MSRSLIKVSGADRASFLQGLVTNDVEKLSQGLVYAALLTPQGKYLADFFMVPGDDEIFLDVHSEMAAGVVQRLSMYKLRADVNLELTDLHLNRGLGPCPEDGYPDPRDRSLGWRAYRETAQADDSVDWDALYVAALVPQSGKELVANESYILEMGFERLKGVDFKKGCYVGQEVTARMKHKTELRKGLVQVELEVPTNAGDEITSAGKTIGKMFTRSGKRGLAYLRFPKEGAELSVGGSAVRIVRTDSPTSFA